jgi:mono/diheme cytochrome c family protein
MAFLAVGVVVAAAPSLVTGQEASAPNRAVYDSACSSCHGPTMGGGHGPPLHGETFMEKWRGKTAAELASYIQMTMPADSPGSLTDEDTVGIVDLIIHENRLAARPKAGASLKDLEQIKID